MAEVNSEKNVVKCPILSLENFFGKYLNCVKFAGNGQAGEVPV